MGYAKSTTTQTAKGKRVRIDSNSLEPPTRNWSGDREKK